jgi:hypothetical protein
MIEHFDAHDLIALIIIVGGMVLYYIRPDQEILAIITMIAGFYFGRNQIKVSRQKEIKKDEKNNLPTGHNSQTS